LFQKAGDIDDDTVSVNQNCFFPGDEYYQPNAPKKPKQKKVPVGSGVATATAIPAADLVASVTEIDTMEELEDDADAEYFVGPVPVTSESASNLECYDDDYLEDLKAGSLFNTVPTRKGTDDDPELGDSISGASGGGGIPSSVRGGGEPVQNNHPEPMRAQPSKPKSSLPLPPQTIDFSLVSPLGMRVGQTCVVEAVYPDGQAKSLGVKEGCVILSVENDSVTKLSDIMSMMTDFKACGLSSISLKVTFPVSDAIPIATLTTPLSTTRAAEQSQLPPPPHPADPSCIDRSRIPRMPWQDMAIGVGGCAARDVALHYIMRWNHHRTQAMNDGNNNGTVHLPILLPFSDNLDTDYSTGWPNLSGITKTTQNLNSFVPSPMTNSGPQAANTSRTASISQEVEKVMAEEERLMADFSGVMTTAKLESLGALPMPVPGAATSEACNIQVLRSVGQWSLGCSTETSIQGGWIDAINKSEHFIYIEQQYFISNLDPPGVEAGQASHIAASEASHSRAKAEVISKEPSLANESFVNLRGKPQASKPECELLRTRFVATVPPGCKAGDIFHVKTSDPISGVGTTSSVTVPHGMGPGARLVIEVAAQPTQPTQPTEQQPPQPVSDPSQRGEPGRGGSMMNNIASTVAGTMENIVVGGANVVLKGIQERLEGRVQNRIGHALHQRLRKAILKNKALEKQRQRKVPFRVLVVLPLHPNGRFLHSTECMAVMQAQFDTIGRGDRSLLGRLSIEFPDVDLGEYILFTSLRAHGELTSGPVSEQVYVHSKCLIVDDRVAIVGSSNLNDRSMCGDRDSEIAVKVTEPLHCTPTQMDGDHFAAAEFAHSLRLKLWRDHLGMVPLGDQRQLDYAELYADTLQRSEFKDGGGVQWWDDDLSDPVCNDVWQLIRGTATNNTHVLEGAFDERPWNEMSHLVLARKGLGLSKGSVARQESDVMSTDALLRERDNVERAKVAQSEGLVEGGSEKQSKRGLRSNESVRQVLREGNVRGRLVLFPHQFLHKEELNPDIATRLLIGKNLFL